VTELTDRRKFVLGSIDEEEEVDLYATNPNWFRSVFNSGIQEVEGSKRSFVIRAADSAGQRSKAAMLINKMYTWRGYGEGHTVEDRPDQLALVATDFRDASAIGTLTVSLDGPQRLFADRMYPAEVQALRDQGRALCEIVKFAVDRSVRQKSLLTALFHVAFIYSYFLSKRTDLIIEVTPQHSVFYRHMLHFDQIGAEKLNTRVNTKGVLLRLDLDRAADEIRKFGGQGPMSSERSLYPYAFSEKEQEGVIERLSRIEADTDST
jgi:hypothetical protein